MLNSKVWYIIALIIAGGVTTMLSVYAYKRRNVAGTSPFCYLFVAMSLYSFGYAMELSNTTLQYMLLWSRIQYIGIATIPALWIMSALVYSDLEGWLNRRKIALILIIPLITIVLHFTDDYHHLYYAAVTINNTGPFPLLAIDKGPWYYVQMVYAFLILVFSSILLLNKWLKVEKTYRHQTTIMLVGSLIPWVGQLVYLLGKSPWNLDIIPFLFTISGLIFVWGVFKYGLLDLVPVARGRVFESMSDGVLVFDASNRLVDYNAVGGSLFTTLNSQDLGKEAADLLGNHPDLLRKLLSSNDEQQHEHLLSLEQDGVIKWYNCRISPILSQSNLLVGNALVLTDVTVQAEKMEGLRTMATMDGLTNIFNRKHFFEQSCISIIDAKENQQQLSIILMDIDNFKKVNDTYGHQAGDITLQTITEICRNNLRPMDLLGRYGGEEFAILLLETSCGEASLVAERIRKKIAENQIWLDNELIQVTASFGVTSTRKMADEGLDELLKRADQALYRAKAAGRNCVMQSE